MPFSRTSASGSDAGKFSAALCAALLFSVSSLHAKGRKPPELRFETDPAPVVQGHTLEVRLHAPASLKSPRMSLGGRSADFFLISTDTWRALWGVSSEEAPGVKQARFEAGWREAVLASTVAFTVEEGTFPVSHVPLTKAQNNLFTSGQLERDNKTLSASWAVPPSPEKMWSGYFVMPTTGVISSVFGARRRYGDGPPVGGHSGTDIANDEGTPITAPAAGRVVFSRRLDSFGNAVVLDHGQGVYTYYLHMRQAFVHEGDALRPGTLIGLMGKEGIATGPHLHWSMVVAGERVSALEWTERIFE